MSFLLRNRNNSGGGGGIIVPPNSRFATGSSSTTTQGSTTGVRSGNQVLLHRQPTSSQRGGSLNQAQKQNQMQESQGVISMSEVLADLKVLEQQQRDSQLKLANARQLMQERNQQSCVLETKLGSLTYANGELRAQITQYRETLSVSNRSLSSRKLMGDRANTNIRNFEKNLKKGLISSRVNAATLSKIDSVFILLEAKAKHVTRIKITLKGKIAELESDFGTQVRDDETMRSTVNQQVVRFQDGANQLATIRTESVVCDRDFLASQNMEQTTRAQTKALKAEMALSSDDDEAQCTFMMNTIADTTKDADTLDHEHALLVSELQTKLEVLKEFQCRQDSVMDQADTEAALIACQNQINSLVATNNALRETTDWMTGQIDEDTQAVVSKADESKATEMAARQLLISEETRAKEISTFKSDLEAERQSVVRLEESAREIKETLENLVREYQRRFLQCDEEQEQAQKDIDQLRRINNQESMSYESTISAWHSIKSAILERLERTRASYKLAESTYRGLEQKSKDTIDNFERNLKDELSIIEDDIAAAKERQEARVAEILRRHPMLQSIVSGFTRYRGIDYEDHAREALTSLKDELRKMIRAKRDAKKSGQEDYKTAKLKVMRNERDRRDNRERIQSEIERQIPIEVPDTALPNRPSIRNESSTRVNKSADFFNPASQEEFSEEETPAQPKALLSSFSNARGLAPTRSLDLTPSTQKRVHWKEDSKQEQTAPESSAEQKPNVFRRSKSYSTSQRGLAAIAPVKNSNKKPKRANSFVDPVLDIDDDFNPVGRASDALLRSEAKSTKNLKNIGSHDVRLSVGSHSKLPEQKIASSKGNSHHSASSNQSEKEPSDKATEQRSGTEPIRTKVNQPGNTTLNRNLSRLASNSMQSGAPHSTAGKKTSDSCGTPSSLYSREKYRNNAEESSSKARHSKSRPTTSALHAASSKSVSSETSRSSRHSTATQGSKKRTLPISTTSTQTSGLSSSEGVHKVRRRNKSNIPQRPSGKVVDDAYAFAF